MRSHQCLITHDIISSLTEGTGLPCCPLLPLPVGNLAHKCSARQSPSQLCPGKIPDQVVLWRGLRSRKL